MKIKNFIAATLLFLGLSFGAMAAAPALDQSSLANCAGCGGSTTGPAITISTSGTNELVIIFVGGNRSAAGATAITWTPSGCGLTWNLRATGLWTDSGGHQGAVQEYWAAAATQLSACTVTNTASIAEDAGVILQMSFTGVASLVTPFDASGTVPSVSSVNKQPPSATITSTQAAFLLSVYVNDGNNNNNTSAISGSATLGNTTDGAHSQFGHLGGYGGAYASFQTSLLCCSTGNTPFGDQGVIVDAIAGTGGGGSPTNHGRMIMGLLELPDYLDNPYLRALKAI
jgi:hypothetical protein